jgi:hypothetical protein
VRIIKSGWGDSYDLYDSLDYNGCFRVDLTEDTEEMLNEFLEDEPHRYFIYFKVFGKYYIAYGNNETLAWEAIVIKAREESKNIFSRSSNIDRHKI